MDNTKMNIPQIDKQIFKDFHIRLVYLFGSRAKGNVASESDFDIAVLFQENGDSSHFLDKTFYLKEELRDYFPNEVDIVALNDANSLLKYEVIANGILLFADSEKLRTDFEVLSVKQCIDDRYIRDIYYNALKERIEKGVFR
jgi:predicted nucleotidyltransferase